MKVSKMNYNEKVLKFLNKGKNNLHSVHSIAISLDMTSHRVNTALVELIFENKVEKYKRGGRILYRPKEVD